MGKSCVEIIIVSGSATRKRSVPTDPDSAEYKWMEFAGRHAFGVTSPEDTVEAAERAWGDWHDEYDRIEWPKDRLPTMEEEINLKARAIFHWCRGAIPNKVPLVVVIDQAPREFGSVLDAGCGAGVFTSFVKHSYGGVRVAGLDASARLIDECRAFSAKAGVDVEWKVGNIEQLPYCDGEFDLVICDKTLHWMNEAWKTGIEELSRVNSDKGLLLFTYNFGEYCSDPVEVFDLLDSLGYSSDGLMLSDTVIMFRAVRN